MSSRRIAEAARRAGGFLDEREGDALFELARRAAVSGLGPLVEIGAYQGRSTLFLAAGLAAAIEAGAPATLLFSVDHHRGSEEMQAGWEHHDPRLVDPESGRMDSLPVFRRNLERAGAEGLVAAIIGESAAVARLFATGCSLVFVDGGHGEESAWADYRGWSPKVVPGGFLAFHDVFANPAEGGRPPYECYRHALERGGYVEDRDAGRGSLRVLVRRPLAQRSP